MTKDDIIKLARDAAAKHGHTFKGFRSQEEPTMNCCDDYGNCRQGRDCPIRIRREWKSIDNKLAVAMWSLVAVFICTIIGSLVYLILGVL